MEHLGGSRLFSCAQCDTFLTNRGELISTRFTGATGRAFLFNKVVNLIYSETQDRVMLTGRHIVRDVSCKSCNVKLGWIYEFATEDNQRYKEGRVILERALVNEHDGLEEYVPTDASAAGGALPIPGAERGPPPVPIVGAPVPPPLPPVGGGPGGGGMINSPRGHPGSGMTGKYCSNLLNIVRIKQRNSFSFFVYRTG